MLLDWERDHLGKFVTRDGTIYFECTARAIGIEAYEGEEFDWLRSFVAKHQQSLMDSLMEMLPDIRQMMTPLVSVWRDHYIGYQFENQQRATRRLMLIVPIVIALIFILLYITFTSVTQALLVVGNIPFALVGGIAALWIRHMNLNLSASVGFIALLGVAMLNGVVLIASINQFRNAGEPVRYAVLAGARRRLRPVLMTACVASFGFIPMALATSTGAEVQRPLATVVIGGLFSSTLLTLILLPVLYDSIFGISRIGEAAS
jgi:Cu/Ag efflux pump CusA